MDLERLGGLLKKAQDGIVRQEAEHKQAVARLTQKCDTAAAERDQAVEAAKQRSVTSSSQGVSGLNVTHAFTFYNKGDVTFNIGAGSVFQPHQHASHKYTFNNDGHVTVNAYPGTDGTPRILASSKNGSDLRRM